MLTELCKELNNWFEKDRIFGTFTIEDGSLSSCDFLQDGQYFRIIDSVFNDGVWQYPTSDLTDETFRGAVWAMAVPSAVIDLAAKIDEWESKYGGTTAANSPFNSESFEGYSYSKSTGASSGGGGGANVSGWQAAFASELNNWRKL